MRAGLRKTAAARRSPATNQTTARERPDKALAKGPGDPGPGEKERLLNDYFSPFQDRRGNGQRNLLGETLVDDEGLVA